MIDASVRPNQICLDDTLKLDRENLSDVTTRQLKFRCSTTMCSGRTVK